MVRWDGLSEGIKRRIKVFVFVFVFIFTTNGEEKINRREGVGIIWFAPFCSHNKGYQTEAETSISSLLTAINLQRQNSSVNMELIKVHFGDTPNVSHCPHLLSFGEIQSFAEKKEKIIMICHSRANEWNINHKYPQIAPEIRSFNSSQFYSLCPYPLSSPVHSLYIGRTMYESDRIPNEWIIKIKSMDEIWVPSHFNYQIFSRSNIKKSSLFIIPESLHFSRFSSFERNDQNITSDQFHHLLSDQILHDHNNNQNNQNNINNKKNINLNDNKIKLNDEINKKKIEEKINEMIGEDHRKYFIFLSIFKWEMRKGFDILFPAFISSFHSIIQNFKFVSSSDLSSSSLRPPLLLVLTSLHNKEDKMENLEEKIQKIIKEEIKEFKEEISLRENNIVISTQPIDHSLIHFFYYFSQSFVLPSRGEGWGRPYMEAMASGLPTIGTNYSGNIDFMFPNNSFLIETEGMERIQGDWWAEAENHYWARVSSSSLQSQMKFVYFNYSLALSIASSAPSFLSSTFSYENVGMMMLNRINTLLSKTTGKSKYSNHT